MKRSKSPNLACARLLQRIVADISRKHFPGMPVPTIKPIPAGARSPRRSSPAFSAFVRAYLPDWLKCLSVPTEALLRRRFRRLPRLNRLLLMLRYADGLDCIEAGDVLGIAPCIATAETNRALDALRSGERLAPANAPEWLR